MTAVTKQPSAEDRFVQGRADDKPLIILHDRQPPTEAEIQEGRFHALQSRDDEIKRLRAVLEQIASCDSHHAGDVVHIARQALKH